MVKVTYASPDTPEPTERHVVLIAHDVGQPRADKGYFFDSAKRDYGGSGPFDFRLDEAIERAKRFAAERQITTVFIRTRRRATPNRSGQQKT